VKIRTMKYHQPGWDLELHEPDNIEVRYMLWAPQTQEDVDRMGGSNPPRDHWSACVQVGRLTEDDYQDVWDKRDGFWEGQSFDEVTATFPINIRRAFKRAVS